MEKAPHVHFLILPLNFSFLEKDFQVNTKTLINKRNNKQEKRKRDWKRKNNFKNKLEKKKMDIQKYSQIY